MQDCFAKLNYMERRQLEAEYNTGDICRQVGGDIMAYDPARGHQRRGSS